MRAAQSAEQKLWSYGITLFDVRRFKMRLYRKIPIRSAFSLYQKSWGLTRQRKVLQTLLSAATHKTLPESYPQAMKNRSPQIVILPVHYVLLL